MDKDIQIIKVKVGLVLKTGDIISIDENGVPTHSHEFNQRVYDIEEAIRSKVILQINERIGLHNWAIELGEIYPSKPKYIARIFAENKDDYDEIVKIVYDGISNLTLIPEYMGTISNYIDPE